MSPTCLHKGDLGSVKCVDAAAEKILGRHEVGVKDRDELCARLFEPVREGAGLEPGARAATHMRDVQPHAPPASHPYSKDQDGLVVRIVEHLDLETVARPVDAAYGVEYALRDVALVVDGQLDANPRNVSPFMGRRGGPVRKTDCPSGEVKQIQPKSEQQSAGHREHRHGDDSDQLLSNRV